MPEMTEDSRRRLILALDGADKDYLSRLVRQLQGEVFCYKIGCWGFTAWGPEFVRFIRSRGAQVFLDLKYHDIPHSVAGAVTEAARLGVYFLTMHSLGGVRMMSEAAKTASRFCRQQGLRKPKLLAITILTSLEQQALRSELGIDAPLEQQVLHLAKRAQEAGMDGVVASAREASTLRRQCGEDFLLVTPGVRPAAGSAPADDQQRVFTPQQAIEAGADYLVIGRPITRAQNPRQAARNINEQIQKAMLSTTRKALITQAEKREQNLFTNSKPKSTS